MDRVSRCRVCGQVVGLHEPVVLVLNDDVRRTHLAEEEANGRPIGDFFHRGCYSNRDDVKTKSCPPEDPPRDPA